jgi:hypothetical protein
MLTTFIVGTISLLGVFSDGGPAAVPSTDGTQWFGKGLQLRLSELLHPLCWKEDLRLTIDNLIYSVKHKVLCLWQY